MQGVRPSVRRLSAKIAFLAVTLISITSAHGATRYILDFDGTLVNDHGPLAGWRTYWQLKRIEKLHSSLQRDPRGLPAELEVSFSEMQRLLPLLGKGEGKVGSPITTALDADPVKNRGLEIIPGYYYISDETYSHFRPPVGDEKSWLLQDYASAKARQKKDPRYNWRGAAMALLRAAMANAQTVREVVISSSRGHDQSEWHALLDAWKRDGEIENSKGVGLHGGEVRPRAHFLRSPASILLGRRLGSQKAQVVRTEAIQLLNGPEKPHRELVTDGSLALAGETALLHTLIVAEDDPGFVEADREVLEELSRDRNFSQKMKFVLFHNGTDEEVAATRWPYRWTVFDSGFGRPALPEEIAVWSKQKPSSQHCKNLLLGKPTKRG